MSKKHKSDLGVGIGLAAISLALYFGLIPLGISEPSNLSSVAMSPRFWPGVIVVMIGLAGLIVVFQYIANRSRPAPGADDADADDADDADGAGATRRWSKAIACMVWTFVYYVLIQYLGIVVASVMSLLFLTWMGGERRYLLMVLLAVLLPTLLYYFFNRVANVSMPLGIFGSIL